MERTTDRWMRGCISNFYWTNDKLANRKRNVFSRTCRITIFNQTSIIRYIQLQIWLHLRDDHWGPRGHHHLVLLRKEWWVTFVFFHWATATKSYNDHLFPSFWDRQLSTNALISIAVELEEYAAIIPQSGIHQWSHDHWWVCQTLSPVQIICTRGLMPPSKLSQFSWKQCWLAARWNDYFSHSEFILKPISTFRLNQYRIRFNPGTAKTPILETLPVPVEATANKERRKHVL